MRDELFSGFSETGWDAAPWDSEPTFTPDELQILLNPALSAAEAADRGSSNTTPFGCVEPLEPAAGFARERRRKTRRTI